jgi:hypothetical protein
MKVYTSSSITVSFNRNGHPRVIAREDIPAQSIVEVCPTMPITGRTAILLTKADPTFEKKILADTEIIQREYKIFRELSEIELNRRLDSGQISQAEYSEILSSKVNLNALLDVKTHAIPLGYGLAYEVSEFPNTVREFDSTSKLCTFRTVQYLQQGTELSYFS